MGNALDALARYEWDVGADPAGSIEGALDAYRSAIAKNSIFVHAHGNVAIVRVFEAECALQRGEDPGEMVRDAIAASRRALGLKPDHYQAYINIAHAHFVKGRYLLNDDLDPGASVAEGVAAIEKALEINPNDAMSHYILGRLLLLDGRWDKSRGHDPTASFERADGALEEATRLDPASWQYYLEIATIERSRAEWLVDRGEPRDEPIDLGLAWVEKSLAINAELADALGLRGELLLMKAALEPASAKRAELLRRAEESFSRAIETNPNLSRTYEPLLTEARSLLAEVG
jgi:hypothetical protein